MVPVKLEDLKSQVTTRELVRIATRKQRKMQLHSDKFIECKLINSDKRYLTSIKRTETQFNENRQHIFYKLELHKQVRVIFLCNISQAVNLFRVLFTFI